MEAKARAVPPSIKLPQPRFCHEMRKRRVWKIILGCAFILKHFWLLEEVKMNIYLILIVSIQEVKINIYLILIVSI